MAYSSNRRVITSPFPHPGAQLPQVNQIKDRI